MWSGVEIARMRRIGAAVGDAKRNPCSNANGEGMSPTKSVIYQKFQRRTIIKKNKNLAELFPHHKAADRVTNLNMNALPINTPIVHAMAHSIYTLLKERLR